MAQTQICRVLSLDGGGAKGFYTLGVLQEIEGLIQSPLCDRFDLIFGTSTGAIIAALIGLGYSVDQIKELYAQHVVSVMEALLPRAKSRALERLGREVFRDLRFDAFKTRIGIVTTRWDFERPLIFKNDVGQAHGRTGTFVPGFGCTIADAVEASCSAYPFFKRKCVLTGSGETLELGDGGFCANNPTLYAIADATEALGFARKDVRIVSIGVGEYPAPRKAIFSVMRWAKYLLSVKLLQKTLEINTQSMDQLRTVLFHDVPTIRISNKYTQPEMATDMFEHDLGKLDMLWQRGRQSFGEYEAALRNALA